MSKNIDEKLLSFEDIESKDNDLENLNELTKYNYFPKTNEELQELVNKLIEERGENADLNDIYTGDITDMAYLFATSHFNGHVDISKWDVSNVENMNGMFYNSTFDGDISNWNVSHVKDMSNMFERSHFNGDISNWDVSNVENMSSIFYKSEFNGDISKWNINPKCNVAFANFPQKKVNEKLLSFEDTESEDTDLDNLNFVTTYNYYPKTKDELLEIVGKLIKERGNKADLNDIYTGDITNMLALFVGSNFNGDISKWDVSKVKDMTDMFYHSKFNGDISNWDVHNVKFMSSMFFMSNFNGDISKWDVSNVENMAYMFASSKFNGDISDWNISNVKTMRRMFDCNQYFDKNLGMWNIKRSPACDTSEMFKGSLYSTIYKKKFPSVRKSLSEKLLSFEDIETEDNDLENLNEISKIAERKKWLEEFKNPKLDGIDIHSFLDYYLTSQYVKQCAKYKLYENKIGEGVIINTSNYEPLTDETGEYIFKTVSFWYYDGVGFYIEHRKISHRNRINFVNFDGKLFFKKDIFTIKKVIYCNDKSIFICFKPLKETNDYVANQNGNVYSFLHQYNVYSLTNEYDTSIEFLSMFENTTLNINDDEFFDKVKSLEAKEVNEKLLSFEDTESKDNDLENLNNIDNVLERKKEFEKNWEYLGDDRYECNDLYRRVAKYKKFNGARLLDTCNFLINNGSYELLFPLTDEYQFHNVTRLTYLGPKYNLYAARVTRIIKDKNDPLRIRPAGGVAFFEYNIIFNDGTFLFPEWVSKYYILPDIAMDKIGQTEEPFFNIRSTETGATFRFYFNGDIVDVSHSPCVKLPKDMTIEQYCRQKLNF